MKGVWMGMGILLFILFHNFIQKNATIDFLRLVILLKKNYNKKRENAAVKQEFIVGVHMHLVRFVLSTALLYFQTAYFAKTTHLLCLR